MASPLQSCAQCMLLTANTCIVRSGYWGGGGGGGGGGRRFLQRTVLYTCMGFLLSGLCLVHCRLLSLCIFIHHVSTFSLVCGKYGYTTNTI